MRVTRKNKYYLLLAMFTLLACPEPSDGPVPPPPSPPPEPAGTHDAGSFIYPLVFDSGLNMGIEDAGQVWVHDQDAAVIIEPVDAGNSDYNGVIDHDAGWASPPSIDSGVSPSLIFSGQTFDLNDGNWLVGTTVSTYGHDPFLTVASQADGYFQIEVNAGGLFFLRTSWSGYRTTFAPIAIESISVTQNIPMVSNDLVAQWSNATNVAQANACGMVLIQVVDGVGDGLSGAGPVALSSDVSAEGPFYLGQDNQVLIDATSTSESGYILFMNVCTPGSIVISTQTSFTRSLQVDGETEERVLSMHTATVLYEKVSVGEVPLPPSPPDDLIDFSTEVYPLFESLYCTNCHRANSPLPNVQLELDGLPDAVYDALFDPEVPRVNLNSPDESLLLQRPLLEDPPDHPNAAFIATNDPGYVLIRSWIEQGAPFEGSVFVDSPEPLSFTEDIMPIFQVGGVGRGCANCHSGTLPSGGLGLAGDPDTVHAELVDSVSFDLSTPINSPLLQIPASSDTQIHPTRVFYSENDPDFQRILTWITEGAVHPGPVDSGP